MVGASRVIRALAAAVFPAVRDGGHADERVILIVPRKTRKAGSRKKHPGAHRAERAGTRRASAPQRWVKAIGAGTLLLSPLSVTGSLSGLPDVVHAAPVPAGLSRPDPQYGFGLVNGSPPAGIGATGVKARSSRPSPAVFRRAGSLADHSSQPGLPLGRLGIPGIVLQAYMRGQQVMAGQQPGCHLPWWMLAGIGKVESDHADNGMVDRQGNTLVPILGPALNGSGGDAAIAAPGGGWTRAEGPMQFLPSTWQTWGGGGNPNNVYDAALAAGRYLCAGGRNLSVGAQQAAAVFSYNPSDSYVQTVLTWAYAYASGVVPLPLSALPAGLGTPGGGPAGAGPSTGGPGHSGSASGGSGSGSASGGSGSGGAASGSGSGSGSGGTGSTGSGSGGSSSSGTSPVPAPSAPAPLPVPSVPAPSAPVKSVTGGLPHLP